MGNMYSHIFSDPPPNACNYDNNYCPNTNTHDANINDNNNNNKVIKEASDVSGVVVTNNNATQKTSRRRRPLLTKERDAVTKSCTSVGRWIKHYSSYHRILLVGEGDFSFSTCLATSFIWAANMISTSLDSQDFLVKNFENAGSNLVELYTRKCTVMHGIDATTMADHPFLGHIKFDRIIFNFPYAGFIKSLSRECQLGIHRRLVSLFLKNAKEMISEDGEIHISHKTNGFHGEWKLESVASFHRLKLIEAVDFNHLDYPGYNTKYGFGGDNNFNCYPSKTYKFGLAC